jgi:hypothetical protein
MLETNENTDENTDEETAKNIIDVILAPKTTLCSIL